MSILYFLLFWRRPDFGFFELGRFIDLMQLDLILAALIVNICYLCRLARIEKLRWERLLKKDKEE